MKARNLQNQAKLEAIHEAFLAVEWAGIDTPYEPDRTEEFAADANEKLSRLGERYGYSHAGKGWDTIASELLEWMRGVEKAK